MAQYDKLTERARKVLQLAQEEAVRLNHHYIGTEHILLGLVREGDGVSAQTLNYMGVQLPKVRSAVEFIIGRGEAAVIAEIGLTPRAKKVLELAVDESRRLNHHYIETEHLLLGLVREGEGIAAGVLESLGVNLEKVRAQIMHSIGPLIPASQSDDPVMPITTADARRSRLRMVQLAITEFGQPPLVGRERSGEEGIAIQAAIRRHQLSPSAWQIASSLTREIDDPEMVSLEFLAALVKEPITAAGALLASHGVSGERIRALPPRPHRYETVDQKRAVKVVAQLVQRAVNEIDDSGMPFLGTTHFICAMVNQPNYTEEWIFRSMGIDIAHMRTEANWIHSVVEMSIEAKPAVSPGSSEEETALDMNVPSDD